MTSQYLNDAYGVSCQLCNPQTGAPQNPDSGSVSFQFYDMTANAALGGISGNLIQTGAVTGLFGGVSFTLSLANGFVVGRTYALVVTALINNVTVQQIVDRFMLRNPITSSSTGAVTVGGYAAGQDPGTILYGTAMPAEVGGYAATFGNSWRQMYDRWMNNTANDGAFMYVFQRGSTSTVLFRFALGYSPTSKGEIQ